MTTTLKTRALDLMKIGRCCNEFYRTTVHVAKFLHQWCYIIYVIVIAILVVLINVITQYAVRVVSEVLTS